MNHAMNDLDRLRRDWQSDDQPRRKVTIGHLRRRLWHRWLGLATDALGATVGLTCVIWGAFQVNDLMGGIYVGFFALAWVVLVWRGASIRMQSFRLHDVSPAGVVDQALRQARAAMQSGRLGIAAGAAVFVFFLIWLAVAGHLAGRGPLETFASASTGVLFVALVCFGFILTGFWMIERGRNRERRLTKLLEQLAEEDEA